MPSSLPTAVKYQLTEVRTQTHPDATQEEWRQAFPMLMHATTSNVNVVTQDELDAANAKPSKAVA